MSGFLLSNATYSKYTNLIYNSVTSYFTCTTTFTPNNKTNKFDKLSPINISNYLTRLNFLFNFDQLNLIWEVKVSSQRSTDIKREIDLVEEIARLHGFNNFATILPSLPQIGKEDFSYQIRKKIGGHYIKTIRGLGYRMHQEVFQKRQPVPGSRDLHRTALPARRAHPGRRNRRSGALYGFAWTSFEL